MTVKAGGWNTWDYRSYNAFSFLSRGRCEIQVKITVFDEKRRSILSDFRWKDLDKAGPHAVDGSYTSHRFKAGESVFEVESASRGDDFFCSVTAVGGTDKRIVVEIYPSGGESVRRSGGSLVVGKWRIHYFNMKFKQDYFLRVDTDYIVGEEGKGISFAVMRSERKVALRNIRSVIAGRRREYLRKAPTGGGFLKDALEGITRAVAWNTIYDPREKGICTPVSRDWCRDWKGALIFCWDTFLIGMLASVEDDALPWHNFDAVLEGVTEKGFVPNYAISSGVKSFDRSQPPLGAYCVWKTYQIVPNRRRLKEIYPKLLRWHLWWPRDRDGNGDGLLEWGSNPEPRYDFPEMLEYNPEIQHSHVCAAYESGQDNSPVFDDIPFNEEKNVLECSDIGLNSLYAMDAEALSQIAAHLGHEKDARRLSRNYEALRARIDDMLWSEDDGIYYCRTWEGEFVKRLSPVNFFPMIAGVPSRERAERMVREHLLNEEEFWGDYTAPTIARNDPAFADNDYWRGRIWPPFNFLLYEGLRRYDFHDVANELAMKSLGAFLKNWRTHNHVCENYNSVNGDGTDVPNSDPLYAWGALMGYVGLQELADANSREGLRFGNLSGREGEAGNLRIGGHVYDVSMSAKGLSVGRDGKRLFTTDAPAIVRKFSSRGRRVSLELISVRASRISFHNLAGDANYSFVVNGRELKARPDARGRVVVSLS